MKYATIYATTSEEAEVAISSIVHHRLGLSIQYDGTEYNDDGTATHEYSVECHDDGSDIPAIRRLLNDEDEIIEYSVEI